MFMSVTVTVTEALVLHPLIEDRGCITESIRILVPVERMKQKCFQITMKQVRQSQQSVGLGPSAILTQLTKSYNDRK